MEKTVEMDLGAACDVVTIIDEMGVKIRRNCEKSRAPSEPEQWLSTRRVEYIVLTRRRKVTSLRNRMNQTRTQKITVIDNSAHEAYES